MSEKPTAAFVLSLLAGIFILINGLAIGILRPFLQSWGVTGVILPGLTFESIF